MGSAFAKKAKKILKVILFCLAEGETLGCLTGVISTIQN
jgi:hypothetical protein